MMLEKQVVEAFSQYVESDFFKESHIIVFFEDGQVVTDLSQKKMTDSHSRVALMAGAWEASVALNGEDFYSDDQILSLADSQSGFLILPMRTHKKLRVGIIYKNMINPGRLKMKAKLLRDFLSDNIVVELKKTESKSNNPLFENITDDELNELFAFAGI